MLEIRNLTVHYGVIAALRNVSLTVERGNIVTVIGANGAGKTTLLRTVSGLLRANSGALVFAGRDLTRLPPHQIVRLGLSQVPEGRWVFANLTVLENLRMGAYRHRDRSVIEAEMRRVFALFPRLAERLDQLAGTLSGGEQQMLAIGRALMSRPQLLMLDEPSLGIAPRLVETLFEKIVELNRRQGMTIVLVEQNARAALAISHHAVVLETGRVILEGPATALREHPLVREAYLGVA